jgi:serine/threonine-protein kinase
MDHGFSGQKPPCTNIPFLAHNRSTSPSVANRDHGDEVEEVRDVAHQPTSSGQVADLEYLGHTRQVSLAPPKPSTLVPGFMLDRYELLCPIAKGGMAEVWIARLHGKRGFQKLVAVKSILPEYAGDHAFQQMFLDEAHISAGIEHGNVAQILDLGEQHDALYIVMEYVDGESLSRLQRILVKKAFSVPQGVVLRILSDVCQGLHAAHELRDKNGSLLNVVHRDVSPQNILVTDKGVSKLIDFGIAKARDRVAGETSSGLLKGKIQYMAPEQAIGGALDRRADVWAIGAILYHLLAGKPPYDADNQMATLRLLTSGRPPLPLPNGVHPAVTAVVRKALAFKPENRFDTALQMHKALEAAMVTAGLATSTADVGMFVSEHLHSRSADRRRAIDIALAAAAERERVNLMLEPSEPSNSGMLKLGPNTMAGLTPAPVPKDLNYALPDFLEPATVAAGDTFRSPDQTDGAFGSTPAPQTAPRGRSKVALIAGIGALAIVGIVVAFALGRGSGEGRTATQGATQPTTPPTTTKAAPPPSATVEPAASASATEQAVASASAAPSASAPATPPPTATTVTTAAPPPTTKPTFVAPKPTGKPTSTATKPARPFDDGF